MLGLFIANLIRATFGVVEMLQVSEAAYDCFYFLVVGGFEV